ncbi:MAG: ORC1-type DNA replication protein, partial [Desulfurococcales archaeon]|nr:ORC1-type DNA replication protein [Desulfurococcales archaeon]
MLEVDELIESEISRPSVFIDESVLYPEFVPPSIRHRDTQFRQLARIFKPLLLKPGSLSVKALLVGSVGAGKTVTAMAFGRALTDSALRKGVNLKYAHINCSRSNNAASIFRDLKNQVGLPIPDRGLSVHEMISGVLEILRREDLYVLVTLDEFDYFLRASSTEDRYLVLRLYDVFKEDVKRLSFMYVVRGSPAHIWSKLDSFTGSYLMKNIITFEPYKASELFDILADRVELAFYPGVVGDEVIDYISSITGYDTGGDGNARKALAILHAAGKLADKEMLEGRADRVTLDHVRAVVAQEYPALIDVLDTLHYLPLHELLVLKAIVMALSVSGGDYVSTGEVEEVYRRLCEELEEQPRGHTKVYMFITDLRQRGLILTKTSVKGRRGRSTYIGFGAVPLNVLLQRLDKVIESKRMVR